MALLPTLSVPGEEQLTPEQVERLRQSSGIAAQRGADTSPVAHWSAGLARLVDAYGGYRGNIRAGQQESAGIASADEAIQSNPVLAALLGGDQAGMQQPSGAMSLMETASPQSGTIPSPAPNGVQADPGIADYFSNARRAESGGDDLARNPNSSATGRYQFIDSTWRGLMNNYPELGLTWDGRTDPAQQERAMQRFTSDNAAVLERSGIPVDGGSLYAAHFLGPGGAVNALSQPDQTPMAAVVGDGVVKANPFLANMTVGDFRNWSAQKGGGGAAAPGGMSGGGMPQQGPSPVVGALAQAMGNPWVAQKYGPVMEALMGQEMQRGNMSYQQQLRQSDPMYQAQLEGQMLSNQSAMQPATPDPFTLSPGQQRFDGNGNPIASVEAPQEQFTTLSGEQAAQLGLDPAHAYNLGPDGKITQIGGTGTNVTVNNAASDLTPGQKKIDEAFADTYLDWTGGGFADVSKQIEQLNESISILDSAEGNVTGAIGALPQGIQAFVNPQGTIAREAVEEVVQRSLREILGAQFTEKEGERLIARAYNPLLKPEENRKRVQRLLTQINSMAEARQAMVDYFDENGTLRGYRGNRPSAATLDSLMASDDEMREAGFVDNEAVPAGVDADVWSVMTPEERALFQ